MSRDRGPSSLAFRPRVRLGTPRLRRDGRALANTLRSIVRRRQQLDAEIKSHKQLMASLTKQFVVTVSYNRPATSVALSVA